MGYGHAGKSLHLPCIKKLMTLMTGSLEDHEIYIYDPLFKSNHAKTNDKLIFIDDISTIGNKHDLVCHVCTSPENHIDALKQALSAGIRNIIMEKPVATSLAELRKMIALKIKYNANILIVAPWLSSVLTKDIRLIIDNAKYGSLTSVSITQNKSRFSRSLMRTNENIFFIEMPHAIGLALYLVDTDAILQNVKVKSLVFNPNHHIKNMGSCCIELFHSNQIKSILCSNMDSPIWKRSVELSFDSGYRVIGYYAVNRSDNYSQLFIYDEYGSLTERKIYNDDMLTNCLDEFYKYFMNKDKGATEPLSNIIFNKRIVKLLDKSMSYGGMLSHNEPYRKKAQFLMRNESNKKDRIDGVALHAS